eukprot:TRINITY_DN5746_c0_g1_i5.p1 TRINITY_DN5746_c0_g1~~TRINITY_DN5746_c0_g1_i5.p1  ORF type:complete len:364 (+),score=42.48 TRINITY_DN5746_c0_g1_i5:401-1492(+)
MTYRVPDKIRLTDQLSLNILPVIVGVIKILLFHVQTLSILSSNVLDLGAETSSFYDALSAPMNASFPSKDCLQGRLPVYFSVSSKLVIAFILFSIAAGPKPKMVQDHQSNLIFICVFFLHSLYYGASLDIFGAFGCILYDSGESNWYLASFPWLQCSPADEDYKILVSVASVGLLGYLISFPLSMAAIFYRLGDKKNEQDNQRKYGFLYLPYHEKCYWWEVIVTIRRLLIGLILSTVPYDQPYLLAILVFSVLQASILMQHAYWPFRNENENKLEIVSLYMILFFFLCGLRLNTSRPWRSCFLFNQCCQSPCLGSFFVVLLLGSPLIPPKALFPLRRRPLAYLQTSLLLLRTKRPSGVALNKK